MDLLLNELLVLKVIALHEEERGVVLRAHQCAQGPDGQELAPAFAVLDNAADAEGLIEDGIAVAHGIVLAGAGKVIIHDHIVRALEWPPGEEDKRPQGIETGVIDAPDGLHRGCVG